MTITALRATQLPLPRFLYSPVVKAGPWVIFSGMIALDPLSGLLVEGGPGPETQKILDNMTSALPDLRISLRDLAQARIFTTRFDEFPAINLAWEKALHGVDPAPARTSVGVFALPLGATVEIEFAFYSEDI